MSRATPDQNDKPRMILCLRQVEKIIAVACEHQSVLRFGVGESLFIGRLDIQHLAQLDCIVTFGAKDASDFRRYVVVEEELHGPMECGSEVFAHLTRDQGIDFAAMVFVVSNALVDLGSFEVGKGADDIVYGAAVYD